MGRAGAREAIPGAVGVRAALEARARRIASRKVGHGGLYARFLCSCGRAGEDDDVGVLRVHAEREGKRLGGQFQAFTYRIESGKVAEFWFMVEDRYAVDAFWT